MPWLLALDHLVLVHLRQALDLIALCVAEDSAGHPVRVGSVGVHRSPSILILAVALDALHVKVAPVEAIGEIVDVVEQIALGPTRLVVDLDLVHKPAPLDLKV